jgi:hypothetical protein
MSDYFSTSELGPEPQPPMTGLIQYMHNFLEENWSKLFMAPNVNHELDFKRADEWVESQPTPCLREFAQLIIDKTVHVSFSEWWSRLSFMIGKIIKDINKINPSNIVFVIDDKLNKSNTWVTLIILRDFFSQGINVTHIVGSTREALLIAIDDYTNKTFIIHADDVTYSGEQIKNAIKRAGTLRNLINSKRYSRQLSDEIYTRLKKPQNLTYLLAVPYAGRAAINKFKNLGLDFPLAIGETIIFIFEPFVNAVNYAAQNGYFKKCEQWDDQTMAILSGVFQYTDSVSAIYFDHKLADSVSIFQQIYALGPVAESVIDQETGKLAYKNYEIKNDPNNPVPWPVFTNQKKLGPLMKGCESYETVVNSGDLCMDLSKCGEIPIQEERDPREGCYSPKEQTKEECGNLCPSAFYKEINYTINGKEIPKNLTILHILQIYMEAHAGTTSKKRPFGGRAKDQETSPSPIVQKKQSAIRPTEVMSKLWRQLNSQ